MRGIQLWGTPCRDVIADANRATQTVHRLRTLFRRTSSVHMSVEVNSVIRDVLRLLDGELRHRRVQTRFSADAGDVHVLGDVVQLQQVLINILINAAEAIAAGDGQEREIHVQSRRTEAGRLEILIRDTGVGLRESDLDQIFEHFVSSKPEGLGMGLAISRSIVQAHGGRIWAMRNEERGLTMHVDLPIANAGG